MSRARGMPPRSGRSSQPWSGCSRGCSPTSAAAAGSSGPRVGRPLIVAAPEVSVVVPCHAAAKTIGALLDALRGQTLDPSRYEVIVVDPGADGTRRVLDGIAADWSGPELHVVRGPLRDGPAAKRNAGAALARGRVL